MSMTTLIAVLILIAAAVAVWFVARQASRGKGRADRTLDDGDTAWNDRMTPADKAARDPERRP